ncbi:MAG TPA: hypothetical protein DEH11_21805 [Actinobacteria bacterium]|nr:hypothetical protein [Actinomycetota bacterium]
MPRNRISPRELSSRRPTGGAFRSGWDGTGGDGGDDGGEGIATDELQDQRARHGRADTAQNAA